MLTDNQRKEELSVAYIHAIAAKVGFSCERPKIDMDSVDVEIKAHGKLAVDSTFNSPEIKVQLKATAAIKIIGDNIHFPLPINNYNDLRSKSMTPRLLVVFELPTNELLWLNHSEQELIMQKCAYWINLHGKQATDSQTITVHIPTQNILSPDKLHELMVLASKEEL